MKREGVSANSAKGMLSFYNNDLLRHPNPKIKPQEGGRDEKQHKAITEIPYSSNIKKFNK